MPRLVILDSAKRELADIAAYIESENGDRRVAEAFIDKLLAHCERLSGLAVRMGRARPELLPDVRSILFGNYVIFIRYRGTGVAPLETMEVVHVVYGSRDLDAYFTERYEEDD